MINTAIALAYILFISMILYVLAMALLNNQFFSLFEFELKRGRVIGVEEFERGRVRVDYEYSVDERQYESKVWVSKEKLGQHVNDIEVDIRYNISFPSISHIDGIQRHYFGYLVFIIPMLFALILFSVFGNKEKVAQKYKELFKRL